ncbi:MAG: alpha/beta hydrolase [Ktedonobacterales bacterium]|nr:alpha/beta hydrolase [Ktedonobacterales bacterium]
MGTSERGTSIRLPDGRALGYAEYGAPNGAPVFFCHGWGASRLTRAPDDALTTATGVRLIGVDRPGIGLSSFQRRRTLLKWPADLAALADALGIARFGVLGWSAGAPYALACASRLPERVAVVGIASGTPPLVGPDAPSDLPKQLRQVVMATRLVPWVVRGPLWQWRRAIQRDSTGFLRLAVASLPPCDQRVAELPGMFAMLEENQREAYRQGIAGLAADTRLLARPWGFRLRDLTADAVLLWQGEADMTMPPALARHLERTLPRSQATYYAHEGHYTLFTHWAEILGALRVRL